MKLRIKILFIYLLTAAGAVHAQYNGNRFGFSLNYNYTTTSKLFLQPNSSDPFIAGAHDNLDGIYSYSAEFRYRISEPLIIGVGAEYLKKTRINSDYNLAGRRAEAKEGYRMYPFELSLYYYLPFSTDQFKFYMGGGAGIYFAEFIREIGDVNTETKSMPASVGIHVAVGMDYLVLPFLSVRGQLRFRDPEVKMESAYSSDIVHYNGAAVKLRSDDFATKVNIDGITFVIGAAVNFNFSGLIPD